jgi:hypothetical protein
MGAKKNAAGNLFRRRQLYPKFLLSACLVHCRVALARMLPERANRSQD